VKTLLFVDDEQRVLSGLRRQLFGKRGEWEMAFVESGPAALEHLAATPADAVVSDMRMPGMDGAQLLAAVAQRHPRTVRLVLSGHADPDRVQVARASAHRYLLKPCPPEVLQAEVGRALAVRERLDALAWELGDRLWCTPPGAHPAAAAAFLGLAENLDAATVSTELDRQLATDAALRERVEGLLAAAGGPQGRAGLTAVLAVHAFFVFLAGDAPAPRWRRATALARRAAAVAAAEKLPAESVAAATLAALLSSFEEGPGEPAARCEILEWLLPTWGLPDAVTVAVAHRTDPVRCPASCAPVLAALAAAELLLGWADPTAAPGPEREARLSGWLKDRGWTAARERWPAAAALPA
jgi:CheY-like chemotaxis protein